jgi:hypothetical protein
MAQKSIKNHDLSRNGASPGFARGHLNKTKTWKRASSNRNIAKETGKENFSINCQTISSGLYKN